MSNEDEVVYKIVLIGESWAGKTSIINRFIDDTFNENAISTLSVQFLRKNLELPGNKRITLDIWDTAGQERFRSLNRIFYSNAKAVILVYDITNKKTFDEIKNYWFLQIRQYCSDDIIIAIAANKYDLYELREVSNEEGEEFANSINAIFSSTSAKNDNGITNLFENIAMKMLEVNFNLHDKEQENREKIENTKNLNKERTKNNKDNTKKLKLNKIKKKRKNAAKSF